METNKEETKADAGEKRALRGLTLEELRGVAAECGLKPFAAKQLARWLYVNRATDIDQMTDISLAGRERLKAGYRIGVTEPLRRDVSADGTAKYLFEGQQGRQVEAVMIPDGERRTLCVSCQAGCKMSCAFCMTGRQGFHGNLTAAQIIGQIMDIEEAEELTNIVFMGMGEPTDNLPAVFAAIEILTAPWGMAWSPKRITVSSVGRLPQMKQLVEQTKVHIALSLHNPFSAERARLMPVEKAWPLTEVMDMLRGFDWSHQRRLSVEYTVWKGVNDSLRHADALARMLRGLDCRVNLIRYHAIPDVDLQTANSETMTRFRDRLNAQGVTATIRASRGEDIDAACGMLAGKANAL